MQISPSILKIYYTMNEFLLINNNEIIYYR